MRYPARFEPVAEGGFVATFRDIPEAITQGETVEETAAMAADALVTAMDFYFEDRRAVPAPSKAEAGEQFVELPPSIAAKVLLLNELVAQGISNVELASRMHTTKQEVGRIVDLAHTTKIDTLAAALSAVGRRLDIRLAK
ncbi:type II toxin-antitoxin system HicB family antitoxin [Paludibacterium purpuratum]|uniref:Antitoxin HicB n=1 Tax=Paludibacterium purpuratum TaxID=1144873 RepID=A0A4R7BB65_9NEIS|nr:type II toxin-antitoxin system HicB family antitoxin [Paludibacterium purpuratum]TDR82220.1 antitoxin HicB [Paludibacterium purpuratum]